MTERQGVEIDYCPKCRGVWLDRGELDKIVDRSMTVRSADPGADAIQSMSASLPYPREHHDDHHVYRGQHRRKSWLGELFD
jgi:uncharacterized protein